MKFLSALLVAPTVAAVLLLACTPTNAARRIGGSPYDGTWSVAIYTLRGDCSSIRVAARIVGSRVYSEDQSYQASGVVSANGAVRVIVTGLVDPHPAGADYRAIAAQEVGCHLEQNAPALGRHRDAQAIIESGERSALFSIWDHFLLRKVLTRYPNKGTKTRPRTQDGSHVQCFRFPNEMGSQEHHADHRTHSQRHAHCRSLG